MLLILKARETLDHFVLGLGNLLVNQDTSPHGPLEKIAVVSRMFPDVKTIGAILKNEHQLLHLVLTFLFYFLQWLPFLIEPFPFLQDA